MFPQFSNTFLIFYGIQIFVIVFTSIRHCITNISKSLLKYIYNIRTKILSKRLRRHNISVTVDCIYCPLYCSELHSSTSDAFLPCKYSSMLINTKCTFRFLIRSRVCVFCGTVKIPICWNHWNVIWIYLLFALLCKKSHSAAVAITSNQTFKLIYIFSSPLVSTLILDNTFSPW